MNNKSYLTDEMKEIISEFSLFNDWTQRYEYIIDLGKKLIPLDEEYKTHEYKVLGCTSNVWLLAEMNDNRLKFSADSDSVIVKGLIAIILRIYSNQYAEIINKIDIRAFFKEVGLETHLSPSRSNGFFSVVNRIHELAGSSKLK